MSDSATQAAIEPVVRNSYGRLVAYLAARAGDVADVEDALGDASPKP
jgi:RNA polymerase sigma-70 factor (ECF subfamily)